MAVPAHFENCARFGLATCITFFPKWKTKMTKKMAKTKWPSLTQRFCARFFQPEFCARFSARILRSIFNQNFALDFQPEFCARL